MRARRRRRTPEVVSADAAARKLWKELEDERRRGNVQALDVKDDALIVYFVGAPVGDLPSSWLGHRVVQEKYRKPESDLEKKVKGAALGFLDIAEKDPERLLRLAEGAVEASKNAAAFLQTNPTEVKKFLVNTVISGVARVTKRRFEK